MVDPQQRRWHGPDGACSEHACPCPPVPTPLQYQTAFQCKITYAEGQKISTTPVGNPVPPVKCEGNPAACIKGTTSLVHGNSWLTSVAFLKAPSSPWYVSKHPPISMLTSRSHSTGSSRYARATRSETSAESTSRNATTCRSPATSRLRTARSTASCRARRTTSSRRSATRAGRARRATPVCPLGPLCAERC